MSNKEMIEYMTRMRDWFEWVLHHENVNEPLKWGFRGGRSGNRISTSRIVWILNSMIFKYSIGCTMEDVDRDTLNLYREFYNRNRRFSISIGTLITTI